MAKTIYNSTKGLITNNTGTSFEYAQSHVLLQPQPAAAIDLSAGNGSETATDNNGVVLVEIESAHRELKVVDGLAAGQEKIIICKSTDGARNLKVTDMSGTEYATIAGAAFKANSAHLLVWDGTCWNILAASH